MITIGALEGLQAFESATVLLAVGGHGGDRRRRHFE
jgi:hypothetical protein